MSRPLFHATLLVLASCAAELPSHPAASPDSPPDQAEQATTESSDQAFAELQAYFHWLGERDRNAPETDVESRRWVETLQMHADAQLGTKLGYSIRIQVIALLNERGELSESEAQLLLMLEEYPEAEDRVEWIAELAELRILRLRKEGPQDLDLQESLQLQDWALAELTEAHAASPSEEQWLQSLGLRHLTTLLGYSVLSQHGALPAEQASLHLQRGLDLSVDWSERIPHAHLRQPLEFARAMFDLCLREDSASPAALQGAFQRMAQFQPVTDLLTMHQIDLQRRLHGEGSLAFAQGLERWLEEHPADGPNGLLAVLYVARTYLGLGRHEDVLRRVEPHFTLQPEWAQADFQGAWRDMQVQNALAYTASARALSQAEATRLGVDYFLAVDTRGLQGEWEVLDLARRYESEQRRP